MNYFHIFLPKLWFKDSIVLYCNKKLIIKKKQKPTADGTEGMYYKFSMCTSYHSLKLIQNLFYQSISDGFQHYDNKQKISSYPSLIFSPKLIHLCGEVKHKNCSSEKCADDTQTNASRESLE